jgi:transposase
MAFYFFDTSAVVKYYVTEPGSAWVRQLIDAWEPDRVHYKAIRLAGDPLRAGGCVPVSETFSTVTCSVCLQRTGPSGLGHLLVGEWSCTTCGVVHNRDVNAAQNILRAGCCTPIKGIPRL